MICQKLVWQKVGASYKIDLWLFGSWICEEIAILTRLFVAAFLALFAATTVVARNLPPRPKIGGISHLADYTFDSAATERYYTATRVRCRESHVQCNLEPGLCHRTTASRWRRISARFHPCQSRRKITQKNSSDRANRALVRLRFRAVSCCRRA